MAKDTARKGAEYPIIPGDKRQLQRRPDESESAHAARVAYCQLPPSQRSIAAAYRSVKGLPPDSTKKAPGYFNAWSARFHWKEYAAAWDAYRGGLTAQPEIEKLAAARRETVSQAEELQALIQQEIERLKESGRRRRLWLGAQDQARTADLANLATALKEAGAARLAALEGCDPRSD